MSLTRYWLYTELFPPNTPSLTRRTFMSFDGTEVSYPRNEWHKIMAYAMSIHKSQGVNFRLLFCQSRQSHRLLQRNLIYTAITRSKSN